MGMRACNAAFIPFVAAVLHFKSPGLLSSLNNQVALMRCLVLVIVRQQTLKVAISICLQVSRSPSSAAGAVGNVEHTLPWQQTTPR